MASGGVGTGLLGDNGAPRIEGTIRANGAIARAWLKSQQEDFSLRRGIFSSVTTPRDQSILRWEIVFTAPGMDYSGDANPTEFALVASSLASLGGDSIKYFPHDRAMQIEHLMSQIRVIGVAQDTVHYEGTSDSPATSTLAINIFGLVSTACARPHNFGDYLIAVPRDLSLPGEDASYLPMGMSKNKVNLMFVPVDASGLSFASTIKRNMRHFAAHPENYKQAFNASSDPHGSGRVWAMKTVRRFLSYNLVIGLYALRDDQQKRGADANELKVIDHVFGLAVASTGLIGERGFSEEQLGFQTHLQRMACLNSMADYRTPLAVGYDPATMSNKYLNDANRVTPGDGGGRLLQMQLDMHTEFFSAMAQMFRETETPDARAAKSQQKKGVGEVILL